MKIKVSETEQIRAILLGINIGVDKWIERNLGSNIRLENLEFNEIFNITEHDVHDNVKANGWEDAAKFADKLPDYDNGGWVWGQYLLLPKVGNKYTLALNGEGERTKWHEWYFETKEERDRFIIHQLFETQKSFWGKKPRF